VTPKYLAERACRLTFFTSSASIANQMYTALSEHCNPASFPELMEGNRWVFNSSAAEQANVWFGQFQSIVREMTVEKYNFFLDEMISIHNERVVRQLEKRGQYPHLRDRDVLLGK
jgi:hypothetical protein